MNILSLFRETRTIRHLTDKPVPRELVIRILEEAVRSPNHRFRKPWRFIFAEDETIQKLALTLDPQRHKQLREAMAQAPVCLIIIAKSNKDEHSSNDDFAAVCCLIQNIQLLGRENQIGMTWELADYTNNADFLSLIGIQPEEQVAGVLCLDFFDQLPKNTSVSEPDQIVVG